MCPVQCVTYVSDRSPADKLQSQQRLHEHISMGSGLEDRGVAFVVGDDAIKQSQLIELVDGHAQFLDLEAAPVAQDIAFDFGFAVIAGEESVR